MRVTIVDTYYPRFLSDQYADDPALAAQPYDAQLQALAQTTFGTSDAYSAHLRELGHEAVEVVANADVLQATWARENGRQRLGRFVATRAPGRPGELLRRRFRQAVLGAQLEAFAPDVVYVQDLWALDRAFLDAQRAQGRLIVGQIASEPPGPEILRGYDLILSSFPHYVERFRALGVDSAYLRIAFYEEVLDRLRRAGVDPAPDAASRSGAVFVGGVDPAVHRERVELLDRLCSATDLDVYGYGAETLPPGSPIRRRFRGQAWGLGMYRVLAGAKVALNRHIAAAEGQANNMRLYEATGVGAALLTDSGANLDTLFEPGREVAVYEGPHDALSRLEGLLADDAARTRLAAAGQARTMREHTYRRRMQELVAILEGRLA